MLPRPPRQVMTYTHAFPRGHCSLLLKEEARPRPHHVPRPSPTLKRSSPASRLCPRRLKTTHARGCSRKSASERGSSGRRCLARTARRWRRTRTRTRRGSRHRSPTGPTGATEPATAPTSTLRRWEHRGRPPSPPARRRRPRRRRPAARRRRRKACSSPRRRSGPSSASWS